MTVDLTAILVIACIAAVSILAVDRLIFNAARVASENRALVAREPAWLTRQVRSLLPVLFIVLVIRAFVFEPFRIPSASMMPGLVDGDFIIVNKFAYGLRLPLFHNKIMPVGEPERGDVVVFRLPTQPAVHYIKRLIGLPGDHIVVRDNQVYVNGTPAGLTLNGVYSGGYGFTGAAVAAESFGRSTHQLLFAQNRYSTDFDNVVPAGSYFFMGDNRNDSQDSRFPAVGFVPAGNLVGRATRIWMNVKLYDLPKWRRIGSKID